MLRIGHALAPRGLALSAAVAALFAATACHYVDPQCLAADLGLSGQRAHGVAFQLSMHLPYKRYTESLDLAVNGAGGVDYWEDGGDVTTCRRMREDEKQGLARFWSSETLGMSMPRCGPGYAFSHRRDRRACRESVPGLVERWDGRLLPWVSIEYDRPDEERITFYWDMESPLPDELELAFTGTLGLLCTENLRLARNLRRSMPELAARVGC